jgi:hypothetical protein
MFSRENGNPGRSSGAGKRSRPFAGITRIRFKGFGLSAVSDQTLANLDTPRTAREKGIVMPMSTRHTVDPVFLSASSCSMSQPKHWP